MHSAIESMLERYGCKSVDDHRNALLEIIQEIALLGLFREGFFDHAAFYGGTALRIFHGLPRFSEDLDFSLLNKSSNFDIEPYCKAVERELSAYGFDVTVLRKEKTFETPIESAFIKAGTMVHLLKIGSIIPPIAGVNPQELLKIKLEIDTDPPSGADYEVLYHLSPIPFSVKLFKPGSLFAGKLHAVLCRSWKSGRVKGRDLYDYVWYINHQIPVSLTHLELRMRQSGHYEALHPLTRDSLLALLDEKFNAIDFTQAKKDIIPFIKNPDELLLWSAPFFSTISRDNLRVE